MRIAVGADHGGFELKERLREWLSANGYEVDDCGTRDGSRCDYPVIAASVARKVADGSCQRGVIVDGAGIGSSMVANKLPGVRAALCYDVSSARNSREHNDANVLTLGAGLIGAALAQQILSIWLTTDCTEERHQKRVRMIEEVTAPSANLPLAWAPNRAHNAAPSERAFQQSAAQWLAAPPKTPMNDSSNLSQGNLSGDDLERVAARIVELLGSSALGGLQLAGGLCVCCGPGCAGNCVCLDPAQIRSLIDLGATRIGNGPGGGIVAGDVAAYIDHTLLKPDATQAQVVELCAEARQHKFASVCVNPTWVKLAARELAGSQVLVCTVVGFPLGATVMDIKALEARRAIRDGAREIDMVINIGALKSGDDELVFRDIRAVVDACEDGRALSKVIIETALLNDDEKVRACVAAKRARADFVKTSTGFASGGATAKDVALMANVVRDARMGVKASGGVRSFEDFSDMVHAGATRIGASAGIRIIKEATS